MNLPGMNLSQRHPGKALALVCLLAVAVGLHIFTEYQQRPRLPEPTPAPAPLPPTGNRETGTRMPGPRSLPAENLFTSPGLQVWMETQWLPPDPTPAPSDPLPAPTPPPLPAPTPAPPPVSVRYAGRISRLDGNPRALLSLSETGEDLLLSKGDLWQGYRITDITPDFLGLEKNGRTHMLPLDVPTTLEQP